jgi:hypothetical protein
MKYPVHKSILFYSLCSNNSQPQSAITTRFVDGVEEFENVGGAFGIDANKHIIFFTTSHSQQTYHFFYFSPDLVQEHRGGY